MGGACYCFYQLYYHLINYLFYFNISGVKKDDHKKNEIISKTKKSSNQKEDKQNQADGSVKKGLDQSNQINQFNDKQNPSLTNFSQNNNVENIEIKDDVINNQEIQNNQFEGNAVNGKLDQNNHEKSKPVYELVGQNQQGNNQLNNEANQNNYFQHNENNYSKNNSGSENQIQNLNASSQQIPDEHNYKQQNQVANSSQYQHQQVIQQNLNNQGQQFDASSNTNASNKFAQNQQNQTNKAFQQNPKSQFDSKNNQILTIEQNNNNQTQLDNNQNGMNQFVFNFQKEPQIYYQNGYQNSNQKLSQIQQNQTSQINSQLIQNGQNQNNNQQVYNQSQVNNHQITTYLPKNQQNQDGFNQQQSLNQSSKIQIKSQQNFQKQNEINNNKNIQQVGINGQQSSIKNQQQNFQEQNQFNGNNNQQFEMNGGNGQLPQNFNYPTKDEVGNKNQQQNGQKIENSQQKQNEAHTYLLNQKNNISQIESNQISLIISNVFKNKQQNTLNEVYNTLQKNNVNITVIEKQDNQNIINGMNSNSQQPNANNYPPLNQFNQNDQSFFQMNNEFIKDLFSNSIQKQFYYQELIHAYHKLHFKNEVKKKIADQCIQQIQEDDRSKETIIINRLLKNLKYPQIIYHELISTYKENIYQYDVPSDNQIVHWHINFADSELFGFCLTSLFAQDEIQCAEHPLLYPISSTMKNQKNKQFVPKTFDLNQPTPILIYNLPHKVRFNVSPNQYAPNGIYGNQFRNHTYDQISKCMEIKKNPIKTNLLAMAALQHGFDFYTKEQITTLLQTAYLTFRQAKLFSQNQTKNLDVKVVIHTGNWGCGAFGNNMELIGIVQHLAAYLAEIDQLVYYTFNQYGTQAYENAKIEYDMILKQANKENGEKAVKSWVKLIEKKKYRWGVSDGN